MLGASDPHVRAWLAAIAEAGWYGASLERAAALSGLEPADIMRNAGDKFGALAKFQNMVSVEAAAAGTAAGAATVADGASVRDRLFEGLMRGFDLLQEEREAVLKLKSSRDPGLATLVAGNGRTALRRFAAACGVDSGGVRGSLRLLALAAIGARLLDVWATDTSPDMAATMAEADRLLAKAEQAETEGLSLGLFGLSGLSNPFGRAPLSSRDPQPE